MRSSVTLSTEQSSTLMKQIKKYIEAKNGEQV